MANEEWDPFAVRTVVELTKKMEAAEAAGPDFSQLYDALKGSRAGMLGLPELFGLSPLRSFRHFRVDGEVFAFWLLASEGEVTLARAHVEEVPPVPDYVVRDEKQPS